MGHVAADEETILCFAGGEEKFPLYRRREARSIPPLSLSELSPLDCLEVEFLEIHADYKILIEK
jgi:hypothetical protein